jgi:hypothetical protein
LASWRERVSDSSWVTVFWGAKKEGDEEKMVK